jgi:hypothetical protein
MALELLSNIGESELGYDAATSSSMLRVVCETQAQGYMHHIDWREVIANHGFRLVNYG